MPSHQLSTTTNQSVLSIDPTSIVQSDSPTAVIFAIAILLSVLVSGITGLVRVLVATRLFR